MSGWTPQEYDPRQHQQRVHAPQQQYLPQQYQQYQPPQHRQQPADAPKSIAVAMVLSVFFPGAGSMYGGNGGTGAVILVLWLLALLLSVFAVGLFGVLIAWIWGLMAAYADTGRWNAARGF